MKKNKLIDGQDPYQLIEEMTKALQEAIIIQHKHSVAINKLKDENKFLTDTIIKNKMSQITVERREILDENRRLKEVIVLLVGCLKKEYSGRE